MYVSLQQNLQGTMCPHSRITPPDCPGDMVGASRRLGNNAFYDKEVMQNMHACIAVVPVFAIFFMLVSMIYWLN